MLGFDNAFDAIKMVTDKIQCSLGGSPTFDVQSMDLRRPSVKVLRKQGHSFSSLRTISSREQIFQVKPKITAIFWLSIQNYLALLPASRSARSHDIVVHGKAGRMSGLTNMI